MKMKKKLVCMMNEDDGNRERLKGGGKEDGLVVTVNGEAL